MCNALVKIKRKKSLFPALQYNLLSIIPSSLRVFCFTYLDIGLRQSLHSTFLADVNLNFAALLLFPLYFLAARSPSSRVYADGLSARQHL